MTFYRTNDSIARRCKHHRGSKKQVKKSQPIEICRDYEAMRLNELAREKALEDYNKQKVDNKWRNIILDTAEVEVKPKISIWRATFERACDLMNKKIYELLKQIKESDKKARDLNMGFYNKMETINTRFYNELADMKQESEKRNVNFIKKSQVHKFTNDFGNLTRENEKRNAGFQCRNNKDDKFKKMCEESCNRNRIYYTNKKRFTEMDRMNRMNECRTESFMAKRPDSKYDAVMSMNERRTAGFASKKSVTKLEEITTWNNQRNAVFNLRA